MKRLLFIILLVALADFVQAISSNSEHCNISSLPDGRAEVGLDSDSVKILDLTPQQKDSLVFRLTHHYSENFNFLIKADSLKLIPREGDLIQDTCYVYHGELIAVAEIKTIPGDSIDSIWVKVAHSQATMGWIPEHELLKGAIPNDQISEILYAMTNSRIFWMSALLIFGICAYFFHRGESHQLYLLKFGEMKSIYPFFFLALVAIMASLYASIQNFVPEFWQEYYYHPILAPWRLPLIMAILVSLVWLVIVVFIAVVDEVYNHFYFIPGMAYIFELLGLAMLVYLVISQSTYIYLGYFILAVFLAFIVWAYKRYVVRS